MVTVTVVTHNSAKFIARCLDAVFQQEYRPLDVVVVDNASQDGAADMVAREFSEAILIRNRANVGFARANNQAAQRARGDGISVDGRIVDRGRLGAPRLAARTGRATPRGSRPSAHRSRPPARGGPCPA